LVLLGLAPELENGKFGKLVQLSLHLRIGFGNSYHANGKKLHRRELPPGHYEIPYIKCINGEEVYWTKSKQQISLGGFDVTPGEITYIGDILTGRIRTGRGVRRALLIRATNESESARLQFKEAAPDLIDRFSVGLMSKSSAIPR